MRGLATLAAALLLALPGGAASAAGDAPDIAEIRAAWARCTALLAATPDDWTGWRRNSGGGYADHFELHEGDDDVAVLVQTWLIDAIATQTDTACYRPDGTLAFIYSAMTSPNIAEGSDGTAITREGRLYFAPDGHLVRLLRGITADGRQVADIDDARYQLARGCGLPAPHATLLDVQRHLEAELGDIEGNRPAYTAEPLDWCSLPTD